MNNTFFQKATYSVNPKSWTTVNLNSPANYFHIMNMGEGTLFFSATRTPSPSNFDLKISAGTAGMYVEPIGSSDGKGQVTVYNDGASAGQFVLTAFSSEFDPVVLAMSTFGGGSTGGASAGGGDVSISDITISGFEASLPAGNNTIGNVHLNTNSQLTQIITALTGATPAGTNKIGSVDIANSVQLAGILSALTAPEYGLISAGNSSSTGTTVTATSGRKITGITFLSNDGETDLTITIGSANFTLKSGEVLDNFRVYVDSVVISGASVPYRMAYNEKEV